jgi:flagellar protein FlaI
MTNIYEWDAATDTVEQTGDSQVFEAIRTENGWTAEQLDAELLKRKAILAYLIANDISDYGSVAGTIQGFMIDEGAILHLIQAGELEEYVSNLRTISSLNIDVDPEREALVPRPDTPTDVRSVTQEILEAAEPLLRRYRAVDIGGSFSVLEPEAPPPEDPGPEPLDRTPAFVDDDPDEVVANGSGDEE